MDCLEKRSNQGGSKWARHGNPMEMNNLPLAQQWRFLRAMAQKLQIFEATIVEMPELA